MDKQKQGYLMVFASGLLWGTIGLFATILGKMGMNSLDISFYRLLAATVLLAIVMIIKGKGFSLFRVSRKGLLSCFLIGAVSQALYNICYMSAVTMTGMSTAAVLLYTSPVFVMLLSRIIFKEKLTLNKFLAIGINVIGCVLTVTGGNFSGLNIAVTGVIFGVLAGFTYGIMPIFSRIGADNENAFASAFYGLGFGMLVLFFIDRPYTGLDVPFTLPMLLTIIGFGLIPSAIGYIVYFGGLNYVRETSIIPVLCSVENVAASVIGFIVFGETFTPLKVLGIAMVFCSIVIINIKPGNKA